jgi:Brp/Blh family beta-carotene 15,15'-monooxygenase
MAVLSKTRTFSVVAIVAVVVASQVLAVFFGSGSAAWQVWMAVAALAIGIPHGALDHVVTVPAMEPAQMVVFVIGYLVATAVSLAAILLWPVAGFIFVVVMSAAHFGMGDASFVRQEGAQRPGRQAPWWVYAIPAGALPVVVPLTNQGSSEALALVNSDLLAWHLGADSVLFWGSLIAAVGAVVWLGVTRRFADARDLIALALLATMTPPLVAFAAYFGLWHALRHTARLSLEVPVARKTAADGKSLAALWRVSVPGLPALFGTMAAAGVITVVGGWALTDYLWVALAVVWALTVPHMALTWKLDRQVLLSNSPVSTDPSRDTVGKRAP